jgi:hypothetical protein
MIKTILNPDLYHGTRKNNNFFEGWYFKLVDPSQKYSYCFIPGITLSGDKHSFIQILEGHTSCYKYIKYPAESFTFDPSSFHVNISNNSFCISEINVDLMFGSKHITGKLQLKDTKLWPGSVINPGSMGFYNYLSFMQCYSQVCSIDSNIVGSLIIGDTTIDFTGGKAYIEKNWGKAFPNSYIWSQCNNFNITDTALTCSIANIPLPISNFTGFLIGLYINGSFHKFTSINRSSLKLDFSKNSISIATSNKSHHLRFVTYASPKSFMNLYAPRGNAMLPIAKESLQGDVSFELFDNSTNSLLYHDRGYCCGLEFGGNYKTLSINNYS